MLWKACPPLTPNVNLNLPSNWSNVPDVSAGNLTSQGQQEISSTGSGAQDLAILDSLSTHSTGEDTNSGSSSPSLASTHATTPLLELGNTFSVAKLEGGRDIDHVVRSEAMSFSQSRFWLLQNYLQDKIAFNIVISLTLEGEIRPRDLTRAVSQVAQSHEALRTRFSADRQGNLTQSVTARSPLQLVYHKVTGSEEGTKDRERLRHHVYDLETET